jgi:hypothetical protein
MTFANNKASLTAKFVTAQLIRTLQTVILEFAYFRK